MLSPAQIAQSSLTVLLVLQVVMLSALFAGVPPHPPETTPLFGIGPFIGASLAIAAAAIISGPVHTRTGRILACLAAAAALVSFGPQKYLDPQIPLIWPSVLTAQVATIALVYALISQRNGTASA